MIKPDILENDVGRVSALKSYSILDTLPEKEYDDITFLASQICQTPISLISLVDDKRQWFKSHHGLDSTETPREVAFCAHAINDQENVFVIPDSRKDIRFKDNPLVKDDPHVIFYVGIPLVNSDGYALGTLCVIDNKPNQLTDLQIKSLKCLSSQLLKLFELRKNTIALSNANYELQTQNKGLNDFVKMAAHDIKSPMSNIIMISELMQYEHANNMSDEGKKLLSGIHASAEQLTQLVDGILKYSKDSSLITRNKEDLNLNKTILAIIRLLDNTGNVRFDIDIKEDLVLFCNKTAVQQILINIISNSIKYNDKDQTEIKIKIRENHEFIKFNIIDNGPGIKDEEMNRAFDLFSTTSNKDRDGFHGTGIGLATVKSLIESLGGTIRLSSKESRGLDFGFTIKKEFNFSTVL